MVYLTVKTILTEGGRHGRGNASRDGNLGPSA